MEGYRRVSTGHRGIDWVVDALRLGDNVVWQTDDISSYRSVVSPFVAQAAQDGRRIVYVRFASHAPLVDDGVADAVHLLDPTPGFEHFATAVHRLVTDEGPGAFYVFDSLTELLDAWRSDLMVLNFFKVTCPYLYDLDTVAYFCLLRGQHSFATVAGIRETTQLLLELHHISDVVYLHALKVFSRYSPTMFFPHRVSEDSATPVTSSQESSRLFGHMNRQEEPEDRWRTLMRQGWDAVTSDDRAEQDRIHRLLSGLLLGRGGRMVELAASNLQLEDLLEIADREIGTGFIGGKSVGMLTAGAIVAAHPDLAPRLEEHDSFYLGSDLFFTYIIANGWWKEWMAQKTEEGYYTVGAELHEKLRHGSFPPPVRERFLRLLEYFGQSPIIVRSSSLLEDNFGNAFAGKYESTFLANQGTPEARHRAFEDAVRAVYSSAMSPEALAYRQRRDLVADDEQMAVLVQRVSGDHHEDLFFPHAGGVGNSHNLYVYASDIDPEAGALRLVVGLGTRAVDHITDDYARVVTLDDWRRTPIAAEDASRYTQRSADVMDLSLNEKKTVHLSRLRALDMDWSPFLSPDRAQLRRWRELRRTPRETPVVVDFAGLMRSGFADYMRTMLQTLSDAYDYPVDIEFTVNLTPDGDFRVCLVQCRPLQTRGVGASVRMPDVEPVYCLFHATGGFMGGNVRLRIDHVVLVRPERYLRLGQQQRYAVARALGEVNRTLDGNTMFIAPGRWGTSTTGLGVPVAFAEINRAAVLVEVTDPSMDFTPELSFGSHFFQDLVETGIFFAAIDRSRRGVGFNPAQVTAQPNLLPSLIGETGLDDVVHVADLPQLVLYSDVVSQRLVCAQRGAGGPAPE